jgi:hypothetical protein
MKKIRHDQHIDLDAEIARVCADHDKIHANGIDSKDRQNSNQGHAPMPLGEMKRFGFSERGERG